MSGRPCEACRAPILFGRTAAGKNMPLDEETDYTGTREVRWAFESDGTTIRRTAVGEPGHLSHYATCPEADRFRRRP